MRPSHRLRRSLRSALLGIAILSLGDGPVCRADPFSISVEAVGRVVKAEDGFPLNVYELSLKGAPRAPERARGVLFYVQGSEYVSVQPAIERFAGATLMGVRVVLVERRGVGFDTKVDREVAIAASTKRRRVLDHRAVIDSVLGPATAGRPVIVLGASEGGDVASAIAAQDARITHLVLWGSGGGLTQAEELSVLLQRDGQALGFRTEAELTAALDRVHAAPDALEMLAGHPYRRWSSFLWSPPVDDLVRVGIPIFLAHGARDRSVPVESARALVGAFRARRKPNLTYHEYPTLDHGFTDEDGKRSGFPLLEVDLVAWFARNGVLSAAEAETYASRVRRAHPALFDPPK